MKPAMGFLRGPHGAKVAYATHGQGPTVVCPASWVSHLERDFAYPPFRSFFEALGQKLTVVRYDRPGMGLSDSPAASWSLDDEVALLRSVLDHLGSAPVSIFGVSSGGPPAIAMAASEPIGAWDPEHSPTSSSPTSRGPSSKSWGAGSARRRTVRRQPTSCI